MLTKRNTLITSVLILLECLTRSDASSSIYRRNSSYHRNKQKTRFGHEHFFEKASSPYSFKTDEEDTFFFRVLEFESMSFSLSMSFSSLDKTVRSPNGGVANSLSWSSTDAKAPTKSPTKLPTKSPTKLPTKSPTRLPDEVTSPPSPGADTVLLGASNQFTFPVTNPPTKTIVIASNNPSIQNSSHLLSFPSSIATSVPASLPDMIFSNQPSKPTILSDAFLSPSIRFCNSPDTMHSSQMNEKVEEVKFKYSAETSTRNDQFLIEVEEMMLETVVSNLLDCDSSDRTLQLRDLSLQLRERHLTISKIDSQPLDIFSTTGKSHSSKL